MNAIGRPFPSPYRPIGPCITGVIDDREGHENPLDGYVIQEGTCPRAIAPFLQALVDLMPGKVEPANDTLADKAQACLASVGSHIFGPYFRHGAIEKTQIYLVMSHDSKSHVVHTS